MERHETNPGWTEREEIIAKLTPHRHKAILDSQDALRSLATIAPGSTEAVQMAERLARCHRAVGMVDTLIGDAREKPIDVVRSSFAGLMP